MIPVFLCSPHQGGVTDALGEAAASGLGSAGQTIKLCRSRIEPCRGCGICHLQNGKCVLPRDAADDLFDLILAAKQIVFSAPVYFYALPGQFKVFIDRSQKFWQRKHSEPGPKKAGIIMAAGRLRGERLFQGSLLTLSWFLKPFGYQITEKALFRGLDKLADVEPSHLQGAFDLGKRLIA